MGSVDIGIAGSVRFVVFAGGRFRSADEVGVTLLDEAVAETAGDEAHCVVRAIITSDQTEATFYGIGIGVAFVTEAVNVAILRQTQILAHARFHKNVGIEWIKT